MNISELINRDPVTFVGIRFLLVLYLKDASFKIENKITFGKCFYLEELCLADSFSHVTFHLLVFVATHLVLLILEFVKGTSSQFIFEIHSTSCYLFLYIDLLVYLYGRLQTASFLFPVTNLWSSANLVEI